MPPRTRPFLALLLFSPIAACGGAAPDQPGAAAAPADTIAVVAPAPEPTLTPAGETALATLADAERFDAARIGIGGWASPYVEAFRVLLADPAAGAAFDTLSRSPRPVARLYGLSGLYFKDPARFGDHVTRVVAQGGDARRMSGCLSWTEPVIEIVRSADPADCDIARGCTPLAMAAADIATTADPG